MLASMQSSMTVAFIAAGKGGVCVCERERESVCVLIGTDVH